MNTNSPAPIPCRGVMLAVGLVTLFATGIGLANVSASSAATDADCIVIQCPTISTPTLPSIPTISAPLGATSTVSTPTTAPGATPGGSTPPPSGQPAATPSAFSYSVARVSLKRIAGVRRVSVELSLSQPATIVSVLHRGGVPSLVDVRSGRAGMTSFTLALSRRIKAGRYTLRLVFARAEEHYTYTRLVAVPR